MVLCIYSLERLTFSANTYPDKTILDALTHPLFTKILMMNTYSSLKSILPNYYVCIIYIMYI